MPPAELPDFDIALGEAEGELVPAELSEIHGAACGLACRQQQSDSNDFLQLLDTLQLVTEPRDGLRTVLLEMFEATRSQLSDDLLRLSLWLPGDEESLDQRTAALGQWCTGFLAGLGGAGAMDHVSEDAREAMEDLREIAQAETGGGVSEEDDEDAFMQIVEYLRVVTLLLREELRGPAPTERIH
jgi:uncharacterized protein YgfB (UPF0149 family)